MDYLLNLHNSNTILAGKGTSKNSLIINDKLSLHFTFNGNENFILNKKKINLFPDTFLTINAGTSYSAIGDSTLPVQKFSIGFDQHFVNDFHLSWRKSSYILLDNCANDLQLNGELIKFNETLLPLSGDIKYNIEHLRNLISCNSTDEFLINEYLYHTLLTYHLLTRKEIIQASERLKDLQPSTRNEIFRRLKLAKEYMYSNYDRNISIQEISSYAFMSVTHLIRCFRQAFQLTPHQFLMDIRLKRAKFLLKNTDYRINEIVNIIGLESPSTFIKLFKIRYRITPLKFRRGSS